MGGFFPRSRRFRTLFSNRLLVIRRSLYPWGYTPSGVIRRPITPSTFSLCSPFFFTLFCSGGFIFSFRRFFLRGGNGLVPPAEGVYVPQGPTRPFFAVIGYRFTSRSFTPAILTSTTTSTASAVISPAKTPAGRPVTWIKTSAVRGTVAVIKTSATPAVITSATPAVTTATTAKTAAVRTAKTAAVWTTKTTLVPGNTIKICFVLNSVILDSLIIHIT